MRIIWCELSMIWRISSSSSLSFPVLLPPRDLGLTSIRRYQSLRSHIPHIISKRETSKRDLGLASRTDGRGVVKTWNTSKFGEIRVPILSKNRKFTLLNFLSTVVGRYRPFEEFGIFLNYFHIPNLRFFWGLKECRLIWFRKHCYLHEHTVINDSSTRKLCLTFIKIRLHTF